MDVYSTGCILFILIRCALTSELVDAISLRNSYVSIVVLIISNYGVFATSFTAESCQHYYLLAPVFKNLQTMISQAILGVRTFNIARRDRRVGIVVMVSFFVAAGFQWFTDMYNRTYITVNGNCSTVSAGPHPSAWIFYIVAMVYDTGTLAISTFYLVRYHKFNARFTKLIKTMLLDGLGYFAVLSAVNIFNLILYHASDEAVQSSGASLGYAVTWIMSQRILTHLRELTADNEPDGARFDNVIVSRQLQPGRDVATALRSQFDMRKSPIDVEFGSHPPEDRSLNETELDIRVHVEQSVTVDYSAERETYRKPRNLRPTV
jgi:hypothetical protein